MAYDPVNKVVILFGGYGNGTHINDTWAFSTQNNTWISLEPETSPSPRAATTLVYEPALARMILFGGFAHGHDVVYADTWAYDYRTNTWTDLKADPYPDFRASYGMAYDSKRGTMALFGGFWEQGYFNDLWIYDPEENSWEGISVTGEVPSPRGAMGFVYDTRNDIYIMFGGFSEEGFFNDTWVFDPNSNKWTEMEPENSPPPVRTRMIYHEASGKAIFFGGDVSAISDEEAHPEPYSKMWSYEYPDNEWTEIKVSESPPARALNGIAYDSDTDSLIVFGGTDTLIDDENFLGHEFSDTWIMKLDEDSLKEIGSSTLMGTEAAISIGIAAAAAVGGGIYLVKRRRNTQK